MFIVNSFTLPIFNVIFIVLHDREKNLKYQSHRKCDTNKKRQSKPKQNLTN